MKTLAMRRFAGSARLVQRRAIVLLLPVIVMGVLAGVFAALAISGAQLLREHQIERVRRVARSVGDSAGAYASKHERSQTPQDVELDISALLPPKFRGQAVIRCPDPREPCRSEISVGWGPYEIRKGAAEPETQPTDSAPAA